jgi:hypothetical protein
VHVADEHDVDARREQQRLVEHAHVLELQEVLRMR